MKLIWQLVSSGSDGGNPTSNTAPLAAEADAEASSLYNWRCNFMIDI